MAKRSTGDDLDRPLGTDVGGEPVRREVAYGRIALGGTVAIVAGLLAFAYMAPGDTGGEPVAVVPIQIAEAPPAPNLPAAPVASERSGGTTGDDVTGSIPALPQRATAEQVETLSGVKVMRPGGAAAPGALIIEVPRAAGVRLTPAPDPRLVEKSDHGPLPRIGRDGSRPAEVYARPLVLPAGLKPDAPRIAIVVGGAGLSPSGTADAIARLPGPVTLAFAPYGPDLAAQAAAAREAGHETVLQAPMEPFDYPTNNPGPQTLLSSDPAPRNLERLHWLMGRFTGYVGVMNFLGGKFTADPEAFGPVLHEIAARGLLYVDDGTSNRALTGSLSAGLALPVVRADVVLDQAPTAAAVDAALARLETIARQKGRAVGSANALPVTLDRVERWARGLEARGFVLVPLSAAAAPSPQTSADRAQDDR